MSLAVLRFILFLSLVYGLNCKAEGYLNYYDKLIGESQLEDVYPGYLDDYYGNVHQKSLGIDFQRRKSSLRQATYNINHSKTISEMMKQLENFSQNFPKELLNQKPVKSIIRKFEGDLKKIEVKGKTVFQMARTLEKSGKKRSKKQLAAFQTEFKSFEKLVKKIVQSASSEMKRERNKNLKIVRNHGNDISLLGDAKRCINMMDILSDTVKMIQSIPGKISCLVFGNCEVSSDGNDNNEGGDNADGDENDDDQGEPDDGEPDEGEPEESEPEEGEPEDP